MVGMVGLVRKIDKLIAACLSTLQKEKMLYIGYTFYLPTICELLGIAHPDLQKEPDLKTEWKYKELIEQKCSGLYLEYLDKGVYVLGVSLRDFDFCWGESLNAEKAMNMIMSFNYKVKFGIERAGIDLSKPVEIAHMEAESTWETNPEPRIFVWQG